MKHLSSDRRSHPPAKEANPPVKANLVRQFALTNAQTLHHRIAKTQRNLRLSALFVGILLVALIVPASPLRQALGYGGGSGIVNPTCGQPSQVFTKLLKGEKYTLPSKATIGLKMCLLSGVIASDTRKVVHSITKHYMVPPKDLLIYW
jgi:hypothetical protein